LADKAANQMISLKKDLSDAVFQFLDGVIIHRLEEIWRPHQRSMHETGDVKGRTPNSVSVEALKLNKARSIL